MIVIFADGEYGSLLEITGIELTEEEQQLFGKKKDKSQSKTVSSAPPADIPQFQISAPVSIRPSQFQPNETQLGETTNLLNATKATRQSIFSKMNRESRFEGSVIVVDSPDESPVKVINKQRNSSRKESLLSGSFNYHSNARLNETVGALKDQIDPFDTHLQNALIDDIEFHEYIEQNLEHVVITNRLKAIEAGTELVFQDKTFQILKQVGKGSFGFVYR